MKTKPFFEFLANLESNFRFLGHSIPVSPFRTQIQVKNTSNLWSGCRATILIFWLAAPLTGMIIQPIIGHYSDQTWCRLGRRRLFLVGAIFTTIALILMPNAGLFLSPVQRRLFLSPVLIGAVC